MTPDCYDAANALIGCARIEHPKGLVKPVVMQFLNTLRVSESRWRLLPEYTLALRFAWLSKWFRKKDEEMLGTEAVYMDILVRNMPDIRDIWKIKSNFFLAF